MGIPSNIVDRDSIWRYLLAHIITNDNKPLPTRPPPRKIICSGKEDGCFEAFERELEPLSHLKGS